MINERFKFYNRLGFMNPFYLEEDNGFIVDDDFEKILKHKNDTNVIDSVAVIELLNNNYTFADRTFIKNIYKTPWMAKPNKNQTSWKYVNDLPPHGQVMISEEEAADTLFQKLLNEVKEYIGNSSSVGILLTGGMDSRIIAAVIKHLQNSCDINANIIAITWGIENSRDVVYAKKIANIFGWDWKYFELGPDNLIENIDVCAKNGALYSPIHLHAMPRVSKMKNIDCILAGSFGDSIGRAEYSGVKVNNLVPITSRMNNIFKIIKNKIYKSNLENIQEDIAKYHTLFPRQENYQYYELERQIHYMRKMLNPCMSVINQKIPLFQIFSSPEVYGYMWSLSPEVRTDKIYYHILKKYSNDLLEIPWARTGCHYLCEDSEKPDSYLKDYHEYSKWIKEDIHSIIKEKVLSPYIKNLNIFNMRILKELLSTNFHSHSQRIAVTERLIWIAALADMVKKHNITNLDLKKGFLVDIYVSEMVDIFHDVKYKMKKLLKNRKR